MTPATGRPAVVVGRGADHDAYEGVATPGQAGPGPLPPELRGLALDHVAIAVEDLDEASRAYRLLGLEPQSADETVAIQGVRVRMLRAGTGMLELLAPTGPDTPVGRFLVKRGPGLHHLALRVEALQPMLDRLSAAGVPLLDDAPRPGHAGSLVAFIHPRFSGGVLIELVQR